jgi:PAS domain-containing protein
MTVLSDHSAALVDVLSADGNIRDCEAAQASTLGFRLHEIVGGPWERLYPPSSLNQIETFFAEPHRGPVATRLHLLDAECRVIEVQAIAEFIRDERGEPLLRLFKWIEAPFLQTALRQSEDLVILSDIVASSDDPGWCVEFMEPVDLSAPDQEVVRQVFSNRCRLRFCNAAMGRFYRLADGEDMDTKPWSQIFPRNPANERFVLELIRCNFNGKRIISVDTRFDGVSVAVENDIRSFIRGNMLYRMWGTVRDVTHHLHNTETLRKQVSNLEDLLTAIPDPLLVINASAMVIHANAAAEDLFGLPVERLLDYPYDDLVGPEANSKLLQELLADSVTERLRSPLVTQMTGQDGPHSVEINASRLENGGNGCIIVILRRIVRGRRLHDKAYVTGVSSGRLVQGN